MAFAQTRYNIAYLKKGRNLTNCEKRDLKTEKFHTNTRKKYESKQKISHNLIKILISSVATQQYATNDHQSTTNGLVMEKS